MKKILSQDLPFIHQYIEDTDSGLVANKYMYMSVYCHIVKRCYKMSNSQHCAIDLAEV